MQEHGGFQGPGVTVALALAAGTACQALARHLRLPGIVLLLAAGVLLGPDVAGVVAPDTLGGGAIPLLVGFAVAVILFEGGLHLNLNSLRRQAGTIQKLLSVGTVITAVGGGLASHVFMGWDWRLSVLFGTLVIVTGPTVVTPLLRRIKVRHSVETILEAEGVLIDAVGAVIAVVALQVVIAPSGTQAALGFAGIFGRLGFGLLAGAVGGLLLAGLLRLGKTIPDDLANVFTLTFVLALFQVSNAVLEESGIMSVTAAGMVLGNLKTRLHRELVEFKEQLTAMFIGMLFVLLAADVRIRDVLELGKPGLYTVAALMFVVRPANILVCTLGSKLNWREKTFLSWLAPRGVVAAAIASLFAESVGHFGIEGGQRLRALVFLVIACTVVVQGLSGGLVAWALRLKRPKGRGWVLLGANELGRTLGKLLRRFDVDVVFIDTNPGACKVTQEAGFYVIYGNALEPRTLSRARLDDRAGFAAVTPNEDINLLVAKHAIEDFKVQWACVAVRRSQSTIDAAVVRKAGGCLLFGQPRDLELWIVRLRRDQVSLGSAIWGGSDEHPDPTRTPDRALPLVVERKGSATLVNDRQPPKKGETVHFLVVKDAALEVESALRKQGWTGFTLGT